MDMAGNWPNCATTSGLYALLIESEDGHAGVVRALREVLTTDRPLWDSRLTVVVT